MYDIIIIEREVINMKMTRIKYKTIEIPYEVECDVIVKVGAFDGDKWELLKNFHDDEEGAKEFINNAKSNKDYAWFLFEIDYVTSKELARIPKTPYPIFNEII